MIARLFLANVVFVLWSTAFAGPYDLSYSGRLTEANGKALSGPVTLRLTFFRSLVGNDQVAVAIPDFTAVVLQDGIFQINLSLSAADFHTVFNGVDSTYIQVEDLSRGAIYPRQRFSAIPYALKVPVDGETIKFNSDGRLTLGASGGAAGKFLKFDSPGVLTWENIPGGGDMLKANNLSDLPSAASARTNLGLGTAATKNVGSGAGDVASGNHTHASGDVSGLGVLASKSAVGSSDITDGSVTGTDIADGTITDADVHATANISHLKISGLGGAASKNVGTAAGEVAAGNHGHTTSDVSGLGALATKSAVGSSDITDGSIADADISASAAIAGSKINPNFGSQNVSTTGTLTADTVKAASHLQTATSAGAPSATECDSVSEYGRLKTDTTNDKLYVCSTTGWIATASGTGYLNPINNLSDVANTGSARTNLGLGGAATKNVGTTASDVAAGSHSHTLSAVTDAGSLAAKNAVGSSDITDGSVTGTDIADGTITDADIHATAGISYLKISGLGAAASKAVGTTASDVAAGNHGHSDATTSASGFMSAADKTKLNGIASGAGVDTNAQTLCADGQFLRGETATTCRTSSQIVSDGNGVQTSDTGTVTSTMIANGTIADTDISSSAAIAGTKISPNFGSQNIVTTGKITADGSGLTNLPPSSGLLTCPSGFTMIGAVGARGNFCIETTRRAGLTFWSAQETCDNLAISGYVATMCSHANWRKACRTGMTGMSGYEWVDEISAPSGSSISQANHATVVSNGSSCTYISSNEVTTSYYFRCCLN